MALRALHKVFAYGLAMKKALSRLKLAVALGLFLGTQSANSASFDAIKETLSNFLNDAITGDFPNAIPPFDRKEALLASCNGEILCGSFRYEVYPDPKNVGEDVFETGLVDIFYFEDAYHLHYQRDDGAQYIGVGILQLNQLSVTYFYPNATDVGLEVYKVSDSGLIEGSWVSIGNPVGQQGQRTIFRIEDNPLGLEPPFPPKE